MSNLARQKVVQEAHRWVGTPYHLNAKLRGVGVDCGTFLTAVFEGAGLIPDTPLGMFKPDFHLHRSKEIYVDWLARFCTCVAREPLPGDIILFKYGRIGAHAALVTNWPHIIHATVEAGVVPALATSAELAGRRLGTWSFWNE